MSATRYSEAVILNKMTDLIKLANINLNHFPRHEKYGLSQEIRRVMYEVYNLIVEGEKRYHKKTSLTELDIKHQQLRMMLKLAYELGYFKYHNEKAKRGKAESLMSIVGNAKRTARFGYFLDQLERNTNDLQIQKVYRKLA